MAALDTLDKDFSSGTTDITKEIVIKNKHLFADMYGTLHQKMSDRTTIPYIPTHQRVDIILRYHRDLGYTKSRNLNKFLKHKAWWPVLYQDVQEVLDHCKVCEKFSKSETPPKSVLPICIQLLFKVCALYIMGPMPGKHNEKKYIINAIDFATQWPVAQAVKTHIGNNVQQFIGKEIISKFRKPELLIADRGKGLTSEDTNVYLTTNGVKHTVTTPYHPLANGCVEQLNDSLVQALAKLTAGRPEEWYKQLPTALLICWTCVNRSTGKAF